MAGMRIDSRLMASRCCMTNRLDSLGRPSLSAVLGDLIHDGLKGFVSSTRPAGIRWVCKGPPVRK